MKTEPPTIPQLSSFCPLTPEGRPKSPDELSAIMVRLMRQASAEYENHGDTAFWWEMQGKIGVIERLWLTHPQRIYKTVTVPA